MVGTSRGALVTFERDSDSKPYRLGRTFSIGGEGSSGLAAVAAGTAPVGDVVADTAATTVAAGTAAAPAAATPAGAAGATAAAAATAAEPATRVCSLAVSPGGDEGIACLTSNNQLLQLAAASGDRRGLFTGLQPLAPGFHSGEITGLATCARRPVVATAGADRTLRICNWQDKSAELVGGAGWVG